MARPFKGTTFWDRVKAKTESQGECVVFTGCRDACGYGRINGPNGKLVRIHRQVWKEAHGEIPAGMVICHKCDNPACYRLDHLFIGTQVDNIKDMDFKNRRRTLIGSQHTHAKLTESVVVQIKNKLRNGASIASLARLHAVSEGAIAHVKHGRHWTHVDGL